MKHKLPSLPYAYNALEPYIDAKTMEIHHAKHHQTYVDKLNVALEKFFDLQSKSVNDLISDINAVPEEIRSAVRNHGGGHSNHSLFWQVIAPKGMDLSGELAKVLANEFGNFETFKEKFSSAALGVFGSGWCWLVIDEDEKLAIMTTANQDSPLMFGKKSILGIDLWEHAYYLRYQNKRADYVSAWWNVVNWKKVNEFYDKAK